MRAREDPDVPLRMFEVVRGAAAAVFSVRESEFRRHAVQSASAAIVYGDATGKD